MAAKLPTYTSKNFQINWAGIDFMALAPDTFLDLAPNADVTDEEIGADGSVCISFLADESGAITVSLQQQSPTNVSLARVIEIQAQQGDIVSADMTIKDQSGLTVATVYDAHIKTKPTITRGSTATGQTMDWVFFAQRLDYKPVAAGNANAASIIADALVLADIASDYLLS